jgi:hypothetical protein
MQHISIAAMLLLFASGTSHAGVEIDMEVAAVHSSRNDARIAGDGGTKFSLTDDLSTPLSPSYRARVGYRIADRHLISALYAPLRVNATGTVDRDITFLDATYAADTPLLAVYKFDSYRLTYRYSFVKRDDLEVAAGFTGKIRNAETSLYGPEVQRKTNVGFVPLLNFHLEWRPRGGKIGLMVDADALAAPQGRAEDVLLAVTWNVRDDIQARLGYRMLEGGADNDEVYSFAWLHYATAGLRLSF